MGTLQTICNQLNSKTTEKSKLEVDENTETRKRKFPFTSEQIHEQFLKTGEDLRRLKDENDEVAVLMKTTLIRRLQFLSGQLKAQEAEY